MVKVLFAAKAASWAAYEVPLRNALHNVGLAFDLVTDAAPETVDYIVYAPNSQVQDFTPYTRLRAVLNLWAGVEDVIGNATLDAPLCRMVDDGLTEGMVEWVVGHVLRHHLGMDAHIHGQDGVWRAGIVPPLARDRRVAVMGLGALGGACARALAALNFDVVGWSRSPRDVPGVRCFHGADGVRQALEGAEIAVLLMPAASTSLDFLNAERIAMLAPGAAIVNPGRGTLIDDTALLAALDVGQVGHATLDVFRIEPLPADHRYWSHSNVTVTPHIASETRSESASRVVAENIRRCEAGAPLLHVVDRADR